MNAADTQQSGKVRIPRRIEELSARIARVQVDKPVEDTTAELSAALEQLNSTYEELRVAEEELLRQHEELAISQRALENERHRYEELFNLAPDAYLVTDEFGVIREANHAAVALLRMQHRFLIGKPLVSFVATEQRGEFRSFLDRALHGIRNEYHIVLTPRGHTVVPISLIVAVSESPDGGRVLRWSIRDRTEWHQTETLLHDLSQLLSAVVQAVPIAIVVLDTDDRVTLWNPAAERMFGWTSIEVLGKPMPNIPRNRHEEFRRNREDSKHGASHNGQETVRQRKDGSLIDVALWTAPLRSEHGTIMATVGLMVDNTERREAEEKRRQLHQRIVSVQEDERRRISRELHDHVGQHLTAILLGLKNLQADCETSNHCAADKISRLQELVNGMMKDTHRLAWELRPTALDDMGLEVALRRYVAEWSENTEIAAEFEGVGSELERLHPDGETALYRVAQEALTNVARHSRAMHVSLVLECAENYVRLIIEDDGIGFEPELLSEKSRVRLGVTGMQERLTAVGGDLQIESKSGKGTTVFARVPRW